MWIKSFGFDTDGVIVEVDHIHLEAFNKTLAKKGLPEIGEQEYYKNHLGDDDKNFFLRYLSKFRKNVSDIEINTLLNEKANTYRQMVEKNPPAFYSGVIDSIKTIKGYNIRMFDVTGSLLNEATSHFKRGGIYDCFEFTISSEQVEKSKPDPEPYLKALSKLNETSETKIRASECIVTEDSRDGVLSAKGAGFYVIGITNTTDAKTLWEAGADIVVKKFSPMFYKHIASIKNRPFSRLELISSIIDDPDVLPDIINVGDFKHTYYKKADFIKYLDYKKNHPITYSTYLFFDKVLDFIAWQKRPLRQEINNFS